MSTMPVAPISMDAAENVLSDCGPEDPISNKNYSDDSTDSIENNISELGIEASMQDLTIVSPPTAAPGLTLPFRLGYSAVMDSRLFEHCSAINSYFQVVVPDILPPEILASLRIVRDDFSVPSHNTWLTRSGKPEIRMFAPSLFSSGHTMIQQFDRAVTFERMIIALKGPSNRILLWADGSAAAPRADKGPVRMGVGVAYRRANEETLTEFSIGFMGEDGAEAEAAAYLYGLKQVAPLLKKGDDLFFFGDSQNTLKALNSRGSGGNHRPGMKYWIERGKIMARIIGRKEVPVHNHWIPGHKRRSEGMLAVDRLAGNAMRSVPES
ncbi:hypothetical protein BT63DRAFT_413192 [Microthyrium microscopicum]|uniref:RNase H type-1 domain-containing protein n=1 Tax=Microthyrium microscopicum TaxID=703497 RepID=A0A6A6UG92_9PEZI|nr:hypothetical protein BT63DRAFT_413192 [Microthyrium microscopicum]